MTKDIGNSNSQAGPGQKLKLLWSGKPYIYFDNQTRIIDYNEVFLSVTGLSRNNLIGFLPGQYIQNRQFAEAISKAENEGMSSFRGRVQLGHELTDFYIDAVFLSADIAGELEEGSVCFIIDCITKSNSAVVEIESEGLLNLTNGFLAAAVSVHDADGKIIYISPSTEDLLGYTVAELKELPNLYTVYPEDTHRVVNAMERLNNGMKNLVSHYRLVHKDGSVKNVESCSYVVEDINNKNTYVINVTWDLSSKAQIEHALEISEQKYYKLVKNLPTGVSLISTSGKLLEANDEMKKIMGMPLDFPLPEINFYNHEAMDHFGVGNQLRDCISSKEIVTGELPFHSERSGQSVFLIYSFLPILNQEGEVENVIGYVSDLSQQKKVENESHERANFLNLVINAIKSPFFVKDEQHKWVILNDAAVEMMGSSREALLGKSDYDLYPRKQADVFWKYDELVFAEGSSINEEQITWSDGTIHDIVTHKQLYIEKPSGKKFIVGTIHDISNYKKIEHDLRASELKYRELFDNANDFIITTDLDGNITNANRTLLNHLKTDMDTILKFNVYDYVAKENTEFAQGLRDKILSGTIDNSFEISALGLDGSPLTYEIKASLIKEDDSIVGIQCVFSDVTERKEANLKLEKYNNSLLELNKTKDKFFSIIAHDLRNPYSSMIGFSDLLLEDLEKLTIEEIRESLKIIRNSAKNSLNLLENLLAWSRIQTGRMPFDPVKVILTDIIDEVVNVLFSLAYRKKIEINNLVDSDVLLFADKNMLNTILNNLVMNAIKFTSIGGEITVFSAEVKPETEVDKKFIKISVADTGIGMDAEFCKKLFAQDKPVTNPGTEKEQGTGLGLMLAREMVERHGGRIWAESTPGKGSIFSFLLPSFNS